MSCLTPIYVENLTLLIFTVGYKGAVVSRRRFVITVVDVVIAATVALTLVALN